MMSTNSSGGGGTGNSANSKPRIPQQYSMVAQPTNHQPKTTPASTYGIIAGTDGFHVPHTSATFNVPPGQQSNAQQSQAGLRNMSQVAAPQTSQPSDLAKMSQQGIQTLSYGQQSRQQPAAIYTRNNGSQPSQRSRAPIISSPMFAGPHIPQHVMMAQYPALGPTFNSQPRQTQNQMYQQHNQVQFNQTAHIQPPGFTYPFMFSNAAYLQQRPSGAAPQVPTLAPSSSQPGMTIPSVMPAVAIPSTVPPTTQTANNRRTHMLKIIDPDTGMDIMDEFLKGTSSRTQSPATTAPPAVEVATAMDESIVEMPAAMTPVVSAISDGPAVDITLKQPQNKKKTKSSDAGEKVKPEGGATTEAGVERTSEAYVCPAEIQLTDSTTHIECSPDSSTETVTSVPTVLSNDVENADANINNNNVSAGLIMSDVVNSTCAVADADSSNNNEEKNTVDSNENSVPVKSTDETDEAKPPETAIVEAVKVKLESTGDKAVVTPLIQYDEGQWSPSNPEGRKYYTPEQLRKLSEDPRSKEKPDVKFEHILKKPRGEATPYGCNVLNERKLTGRGSESTLLPHFALNQSIQRSTGGNQSLSTYKRVSQQGSKVSPAAQQKPAKSGMIHVTLSLREDVKLNETENAWRPSHLKVPENVTEEERVTEELYKRFRCVLNKLTPEKFNVLVGQVKVLKIDTEERLNGCIELVFEKAVSEPNFSVAYAQLCKQIGTISVTAPQQGTENTDEGQKTTHEHYMFRKMLLNRCQAEFHTINSQTDAQEKRVKRLDEFKNDAEKHEEYKLLLEEEERKIRWRALGTVRFIGELFKSEMLTSSIMSNCISILMNNRHEDSLECLCKLLTTIGQRLEQNILVDYFVKLQEIVDNKKQHKISSRVRFMIQDLIDLKKNKWVPRRPDLKPKTIVQIQKEAEAEYNNQAAAGYQLNQRDRHRGGYSKSSSSGNSGGGGKMNEDGWTLQNAKSGRSTAVDTKKLNVKATNIDQHTPLGTAQMYKWQPQSSNMYQALSDIDTPRSDVGSGGSKKGGGSGFGAFGKGSTERARYEGRGSHKSSRENSTTRGASRSLQAPVRSQPTVARLPYASMASTSQGGAAKVAVAPPTKEVPEKPSKAEALTEDELNEIAQKIRRRWTEMVMEVVEGYTTVEQCTDDIMKISEDHRYLGIRELYDFVLEHKKQHRTATADILVHAVRVSQVISLDTYMQGLRLHMDGIEEIAIDVPMIWEFIPEYLGPMILAKVITLKSLATLSENLINANLGGQLLLHLLRYFISKRGAAYVLDIWEKSQVKWTDFMPPSKVDEFIAINNFNFLINKDYTTYQSTSSTCVPTDRVYERLKELIVSNASYDSIEEWITANVGAIDKNFIRILTTVVIESCLYPNYKVNGPLLETQCRLLTRYIENKEEFEMQCLFAIQKLIFKLEHPYGLMNHIFVTLYEMEVLSSDSFKNWLSSNEEQEGKGVAVKSLNSFFTHIFAQYDYSDDND
ncbi:eukaryotic translation initiation factor 4 gamma 3 [Phlebotomus argentipes]|uniref:eukaryotic translation initiation factor 4 gamma 3 n=1 Tax=Phlebotomus argentipes TaxID=94469 RepID=UPI00289363D4|nr:eukaryotic translation initiation factor 4 gamma 3 [Phlebotomus argentipes]